MVAGIDSADRDFLAQQAQMMGLEEMMRSGQKQQAELDRYKAMTPHELDIKGFEGAKARTLNQPGFLNQYLAGQGGQQQSAAAKGKLDQGTVDTAIGAGNAKNMVAQLEDVSQFLNSIAESDPETADQLYQQALGDIDPSMRKVMPAKYNPQQMRAFLDSIANNPAQRRAISLENTKGGYRLAEKELGELAHNQRTEVEIAGRQNTTNTQAGASRYTADAARERTRESPAQALARLRSRLVSQPDDEASLEEYEMYVGDMWDKKVQSDMGVFILRNRALNAEDEKVKSQAIKDYNRMRSEFFAEKKLYPGAPKKGTISVDKTGKKWMFRGGGYGVDWKDKKNWEPTN